MYTLVLEYTLLRSHLLRGGSVFVHSAASVANHYNLAFFLTPGAFDYWVSRDSME